MKSVNFESFQNSNGKVKVLLRMVFAESNTDPAAILTSSMANGMLGQLAVDPTSLEFIETKQSKCYVIQFKLARFVVESGLWKVLVTKLFL